MKKNYSAFLIINFVLMGCRQFPNFELESLYRQRIQNSSKVIVQFEFSSSCLSGCEWSGQAILDSSETFPDKATTRKEIHELPCCVIEGKINSQNIKIIGFTTESPTESDTLLTPIHRSQQKFSGVTVDFTEYQETYGSAINVGLQEHEFKSFFETDDSLILYGVKRKFGQELPDTMAFKKGNIKVVDSAGGVINYIEIKEMVIGHGNIYKPGKPLDIVHNQPVVGEREYRFYPKTPLLCSILSDYGIYKRVK